MLLEQEGRQVKTMDVAQRQIADLEARLAKEPKNLKLLRSLAELYTTKKEFDRALKDLPADRRAGRGGRRLAAKVDRRNDAQEI